MMTKRLAVVGYVALLLAGCGERKGQAKDWTPTLRNPPVRVIAVCGEKSVPQMSDDDIVVAVNGIALTKADVDERLNAYRWMLSLNRMMRPQERESLYRNYGRSLIENFVGTQLLVWDAREKCRLDEAEIRTRVLSNAVLTAKAYRMSLEQLDKTLPGGLRSVNRAAEERCWLDAYQTNCLAPMAVSDADVTNVLTEIAHENAGIAATNALRKARLQAIRKSLKLDGSDFGDYADRVNADPLIDGAGAWGEFSPNDIEDDAVREEIDKLDVGQVSGVLEDDECYFLVKMFDRRKDKNGQEIWSLGKMSIQKEQSIVLADVPGLRKDFERQMLNRAVSARIEELRKKASVVYPWGTNFWRSARADKVSKSNSK